MTPTTKPTELVHSPTSPRDMYCNACADDALMVAIILQGNLLRAVRPGLPLLVFLLDLHSWRVREEVEMSPALRRRFEVVLNPNPVSDRYESIVQRQ